MFKDCSSCLSKVWLGLWKHFGSSPAKAPNSAADKLGRQFVEWFALDLAFASTPSALSHLTEVHGNSETRAHTHTQTQYVYVMSRHVMPYHVRTVLRLWVCMRSSVLFCIAARSEWRTHEFKDAKESNGGYQKNEPAISSSSKAIDSKTSAAGIKPQIDESRG